MTQTKRLFTDFLTENGFGFERSSDENIVLTGEWLSPHDEDVFCPEAMIEGTGEPNVYKVTDSASVSRLEVYNGSGPNGIIADWQEWADANSNDTKA
jgi:hypothetical protein